MGTPQGDLTRPPLAPEALAGALPGDGLWREIVVVERTGSTNADVKAVAGDAPEGLVVVAEHQTAGRGRLDRSWTAPPRSGLTFSALLRPDRVPAQRWGWLPLAAGLAVAAAASRTAGLDARVKWPNDVLHGERKLAGVLVERVGTPCGAAAVVGVGLNVTQREDELPTPQATSLLLAGGGALVDRAALLLAVLGELERWYAAWRSSGGDADRCGLRQAYLDRCVTLGREVRAELPDGTSVCGTARTVDADGALVIESVNGPRTVAAGDVIHASLPR